MSQTTPPEPEPAHEMVTTIDLPLRFTSCRPKNKLKWQIWQSCGRCDALPWRGPPSDPSVVFCIVCRPIDINAESVKAQLPLKARTNNILK